ncbi:MAG: hypothetical protein AB8B69_00475 [Chitinophagales bacterium]
MNGETGRGRDFFWWEACGFWDLNTEKQREGVFLLVVRGILNGETGRWRDFFWREACGLGEVLNREKQRQGVFLACGWEKYFEGKGEVVESFFKKMLHD